MQVIQLAKKVTGGGRKPVLRFAVLGAGNGGLAMAGHLALLGHPVVLYNRSPAKLEALAAGGIHLEGCLEGFGSLQGVTGSLAEAAAFGDVLMIVVPATGHRDLARGLAPHLRDGQVVVLNPGRTLGAVEFEYTLREEGCWARVIVAETQTLLYASRVVGPGRVHIFSLKQRVPVATLPGREAPRVVDLLREAFPQMVTAAHVLQTGMDNIGAIFHPAPVLMNLARIEEGHAFDYYHEGITPAAARLLETMDGERLAVATALGVEAVSARQWLAEAYGAGGRDLYEAIRHTPAYRGIKAPGSLDTRYILEDVPMSLVPISSLGAMLGVATPAIDSVITMAGAIYGMDFRGRGRTVERLGLTGLSLAELYDYVLEGREVA